MDYDYVCVMDKGRVAEFGPPRELAQKHNGQFAALVAAHEEQTRKQMQSSSMEWKLFFKKKNHMSFFYNS